MSFGIGWVPDVVSMPVTVASAHLTVVAPAQDLWTTRCPYRVAVDSQRLLLDESAAGGHGHRGMNARPTGVVRVLSPQQARSDRRGRPGPTPTTLSVD